MTDEKPQVPHVVQQLKRPWDGESDQEWTDIATVLAQPRTFTKTILSTGLKAAGIEGAGHDDRFRVLDPDAERQYTIEEIKREPEFEVVVADKPAKPDDPAELNDVDGELP